MSKVICTNKTKINGNINYLGLWAIENKKILLKKYYKKSIPYHWDDRQKLRKDYSYLEKFSYRVTKRLSNILNRIHQKNYDLRYWEFLLFPWVISYNSIIFDRWEHISSIKNKKKIFVLSKKYQENDYIIDYNNLIDCSQENVWNEILYYKIIKFKKLKLIFQNKKYDSKQSLKKNGLKINRIIFFKILKFFLKLFYLRKKNNKNLILNTQYSFYDYKRFFNSKKTDYGYQFLEKINNFFLDSFEQNHTRERFKLETKKIKAKKNFEKFYWGSIHDYLPKVYLENFIYLNTQTIQRQDYKKIYTTFSHFNAISDKFYLANQLKKNKKIYLFEHGGSLPAYKELFNFEEKIFDKKFTFYTPIKKKQKITPLNPYYLKFENFSDKLGKNCCFFCGETPIWNYRVQFYATSSQSLESFKIVSTIIDNLDKNIRSKVLIKPKIFKNGFNFSNQYKKFYGQKIIENNKDVKKFIQKSKFLILTYPETTLIEAVLSKRPFILIYPEKYYERHETTKKIIKKMKKNKIIFKDPIEAAKHINKFWNNPNSWFQSNNVQECITQLKFNFFPQKEIKNKIVL